MCAYPPVNPPARSYLPCGILYIVQLSSGLWNNRISKSVTIWYRHPYYLRVWPLVYGFYWYTSLLLHVAPTRGNPVVGSTKSRTHPPISCPLSFVPGTFFLFFLSDFFFVLKYFLFYFGWPNSVIVHGICCFAPRNVHCVAVHPHSCRSLFLILVCVIISIFIASYSAYNYRIIFCLQL
jgi:hypothetical protein